jgi:hypothetical protein
VLDEMLAQGSFETVADELLMPALVALGAAWAEGSLDEGDRRYVLAVAKRLGV